MKSFQSWKNAKKKFHTAPVQKKIFASFILATCVYLLFIIVCYLHTITVESRKQLDVVLKMSMLMIRVVFETLLNSIVCFLHF